MDAKVRDKLKSGKKKIIKNNKSQGKTALGRFFVIWVYGEVEDETILMG